MSETFKTFVVVNPNSSNGRTGKVWPAVEAGMKERLGPFDHAFTGAPREATELARKALDRGYEMIVSVGGDGTHNEVANGFFAEDGPVRPGAVMAIVTSGTGGDFRKTFGFSAGPLAALERLAGRETRPIDVGRFSYRRHDGQTATHHFINILSFGIGGLVDHMVNTTTKALGGKASFFLGTMRAFARYRRQAVRISLDEGAATTAEIHNFAIANGRYFGGGMMVAPRAEPDDGLFDVVSFEGMTSPQFLALAGSIYKGAHLDRKNVRFARAAKVTAESDERVLLDVDGEQLGTLPIAVENLRHALLLKI
jgi:YegS/Rv2252/BmrU family lipid kinase